MSFSTFAGIESDSIRPLTKVNKEFLIVAHIIRGETGAAGISELDITNQIAIVNTVFKPIGMKFTICEFRYIDNYKYDSLNSSSTLFYHYDIELSTKYNVESRINMYFVNSPTKDYKTACGYASLGGINTLDINSTIVIGKGTCASSLTYLHEIGHFFNLSHTFENSVPELVNGSNCLTAGDGVCDTPADPYDESGVNNFVKDCIFYNLAKDANGDYYSPDVTNIMGYYLNCACLKFSHDQYEKMAQYYLSHPVAW